MDRDKEGIHVFVAWRDLRFARGRFVLIGSVVALITLLVGFLAGLTGGLASQNVSAVLQLPGDRLVLRQPATGAPSFADSAVSSKTVEAWERADGVDAVVPIGIVQGRATGSSEPTAVTLLGIPHGIVDGAGGPSGITDLAPSRDDEIGLSSGAADRLGVGRGDQVTIAATTYEVTIVGTDLWFSHSPVVVLSPAAWAVADRSLGGTGAVTVLAVSGDPDWGRLAGTTHTTASTRLASLTALETFKSEVGSLGLMIAMLFGVSALVVGAFFTVWTMQRAGDVAVLKALGASTGSLVRDALGQALVVLVAGIGAGLLAVVALGRLAADALPFLLSPLTTVAPGIAMIALGLAGAAVALRTVTSSDPLAALGSNR
ncbi:ABC transporter permease [Nocardioides sp. MAHUQ-72]